MVFLEFRFLPVAGRAFDCCSFRLPFGALPQLGSFDFACAQAGEPEGGWLGFGRGPAGDELVDVQKLADEVFGRVAFYFAGLVCTLRVDPGTDQELRTYDALGSFGERLANSRITLPGRFHSSLELKFPF